MMDAAKDDSASEVMGPGEKRGSWIATSRESGVWIGAGLCCLYRACQMMLGCPSYSLPSTASSADVGVSHAGPGDAAMVGVEVEVVVVVVVVVVGTLDDSVGTCDEDPLVDIENGRLGVCGGVGISENLADVLLSPLPRRAVSSGSIVGILIAGGLLLPPPTPAPGRIAAGRGVTGIGASRFVAVRGHGEVWGVRGGGVGGGGNFGECDAPPSVIDVLGRGLVSGIGNESIVCCITCFIWSCNVLRSMTGGGARRLNMSRSSMTFSISVMECLAKSINLRLSARLNDSLGASSNTENAPMMRPSNVTIGAPA